MDGQILNISPAVVWVIALSQLLTFALTIWNLLASGSRANARRLEDQAKVLVDHGNRIGSMEQSHRTMPSATDMHSVSLALEGIKGEIKAMRAEMSGDRGIMERLESIVGRHEVHLLGGSSR
ncbi:DUF2730 family protein [Paracoccaceae bacterium Fryx2]|nr:DUF2730 family protein [Paracoccaceae bacterium Fryx2]